MGKSPLPFMTMTDLQGQSLQTPMTVLALNGSLRAGSFNGHALAAAEILAPHGMSMEFSCCTGIPLFNEDEERLGIPPVVELLGDRIRSANGLVIASPEYNFSISGVLKNTIDWLSRLPSRPLKGKPVAILSATAGAYGGARHQYELRKVLLGLDALVLQRPEVLIGNCRAKFDENGNLTDAATQQAIASAMQAFAAWISLLESGSSAVTTDAATHIALAV